MNIITVAIRKRILFCITLRNKKIIIILGFVLVHQIYKSFANLIKKIRIYLLFPKNFTRIDKNQRNEQKKPCRRRILSKAFQKRRRWYHQESNRGHTDFQSVALPTELWHHFMSCNERCFSIASAKVQLFFETTKFFHDFIPKNRKISTKRSENAIVSCHIR